MILILFVYDKFIILTGTDSCLIRRLIVCLRLSFLHVFESAVGIIRNKTRISKKGYLQKNWELWRIISKVKKNCCENEIFIFSKVC